MYCSYSCNKSYAVIARYINTANYDGTDIARPYIYDNSTSAPVYVDVEDYHPPSHSKRAAISYRNRLWPYGIVPYRLQSSFSGSYAHVQNLFHGFIVLSYVAAEREKILDGMRHWEENTCIRFHPVPITTFMYSGVLFFRGSG